ncbi:Tim17/Tim22/Tim23/Pmp24 [Gracilaria domingensis]|nr:Tim17/Tim22/Tim23/Pmp24 [Gracilaria domingensis]
MAARGAARNVTAAPDMVSAVHKSPRDGRHPPPRPKQRSFEKGAAARPTSQPPSRARMSRALKVCARCRTCRAVSTSAPRDAHPAQRAAAPRRARRRAEPRLPTRRRTRAQHMSWLWSSAPPQGDDDSGAPTQHAFDADYSQLHRDPYAASGGHSAASDAFGDAFDDDGAGAAAPSFDGADALSAAPFDLYGPQTPQSSVTPFDFTGVSRIDPGILSARGGGAGGAAMGGAGAGTEYVFAEDYAATRKKGWGEQLTYLAGCSYLGGATLGGLYGLKTALAESSGRPFRLRLNAILNGVGKRGSLLANSAGVLALAFSLTESGLYTYRSEDDMLNYALAGGVAGGMFRSTAGARAAAVSGLAGALVAVGAVYCSRRGWYGHRVQGML